MSIQKFMTNAKTFAKPIALGLLTTVASISCGGDEPTPDEPGGKKPTEVSVFTFDGIEATGGTVNVIDSTISIRFGGFEAPTEFLLSVRKADRNKGMNSKITGDLFDESNIKATNRGYVDFVSAKKNLNIESNEAGSKYVAKGTNNPNFKVDAVRANGVAFMVVSANDENVYEHGHKAKGILQLAKTQGAALLNTTKGVVRDAKGNDIKLTIGIN